MMVAIMSRRDDEEFDFNMTMVIVLIATLLIGLLLVMAVWS